jgi:uncharacterized protein YneF (UPF0154 family)
VRAGRGVILGLGVLLTLLGAYLGFVVGLRMAEALFGESAPLADDALLPMAMQVVLVPVRVLLCGGLTAWLFAWVAGPYFAKPS